MSCTADIAQERLALVYHERAVKAEADRDDLAERVHGIGSMLLSEAMVHNVAEAISREQATARVEHQRRVGYAARVTLARVVLDEVCRGLGLPNSIDAALVPAPAPDDAEGKG